ncbi:MAG: hypothetical protein A3F13_02435 [Gammaproteobacteria bacterium RIFCSPHIGHO2_12_FULL_40_19]|nr:MAG: hypothetical protein A3F13_02435 [Gammaproteobacteria bacterium RIFCSPHIGHO2_12_FULL_40_19]
MPKGIPQTPISAKLKKSPPRKPKNTDRRSREYLTDTEIERLRKAARSIGRHGVRDDAIILLMFRHGLRVSEVIALQWCQIDLQKGLLHVKRLKNGLPSTHPVRGTDIPNSRPSGSKIFGQISRRFKVELSFMWQNLDHIKRNEV